MNYAEHKLARQLPTQFFAQGEAGVFGSTGLAHGVFGCCTNPEISAEDANSMLDLVAGYHGLRLWILWLLVKNPSFSLLSLEDPSLPTKTVKIYLNGLGIFIGEQLGMQRQNYEPAHRAMEAIFHGIMERPQVPAWVKDLCRPSMVALQGLLREVHFSESMEDVLAAHGMPDVLLAMFPMPAQESRSADLWGAHQL